MTTYWTLGCDAIDPHRLAPFWALALGYDVTMVREESYGPQLGHVVMLDPEGNEFCVA